MSQDRTPCQACGRTTLTSFGVCTNCGEAKDPSLGPVSQRPDVWRPLSDDVEDVLWAAVWFAPGAVVLLLALLVLDAPLWFAVAGVLLVAPLAARLLDDEV